MIDYVNVSIDEINIRHRYGLSVDVAIFGINGDELHLLVIDCDMDPYKGLPSLLGTLVNPDEDLNHAAHRVITRYTYLEEPQIHQIGAFGSLHRHPVDRVISIAYLNVINMEKALLKESLPVDVQWLPVDDIEVMAFDHHDMFVQGLDFIRDQINLVTSKFRLVEEPFTLSELQRVQEVILGRPLDKRNFRKHILSTGLVESTGEVQTKVSHRPAELFTLSEVSH
jgi:8-oxo-dGTP diphosphatase